MPIVLALEFPESTIILDDLKARKVAERLNLQITGTVGVIVKAKNIGLISSVKPYLDMLRNSPNHSILVHGMGGQPRSFYNELRHSKSIELLWTD